MPKKDYKGWELEFRFYQLKLIKKYLSGHLAEVGPGNGANLNYYIDRPIKIDLFEPSKKHYLNLKKNFKKHNKIKFYNKLYQFVFQILRSHLSIKKIILRLYF